MNVYLGDEIYLPWTSLIVGIPVVLWFFDCCPWFPKKTASISLNNSSWNLHPWRIQPDPMLCMLVGYVTYIYFSKLRASRPWKLVDVLARCNHPHHSRPVIIQTGQLVCEHPDVFWFPSWDILDYIRCCRASGCIMILDVWCCWQKKWTWLSLLTQFGFSFYSLRPSDNKRWEYGQSFETVDSSFLCLIWVK